MKDSPSDLMGFVSSLGGGDGLRVEENLGEGFVRLRVSEAERRQAKHDIRRVEDVVIELLRNARDAGARHIYVGTAREGDLRTLLVVDDGVGIPRDMQEHVFEARVTSKLESMRNDRWGVHGRGMALFSIRENAVTAVVRASGVGQGTAIKVVTDASALPERADQSTWPTTLRDGSGTEVLNGPHNIVRTCCEFALEERSCRVYVGSPTEMLATIRARTRPTSGPERVVDRVASATDAQTLRAISQELGADMSERTAYRILSGEIRPLRHAVLCLEGQEGSEHRSHQARAGAVHPRLSPEDRDELARTLARDFEPFARRYYLELSGSPRIRVGDGRITVTFDLVEQE